LNNKYNNFLNLSVAIRVLCCPRYCQHYCDYAQDLLIYFVEECRKLYEQKFVVYNVHSLIHIVDEVRLYGCLDSISSFPFEDFLGQIKRTIRKPQHILQQLSNRMAEGYLKPRACQNLAIITKKEHTAGPVVIGMMHLKEFRELHLPTFVLKVHTGDS
jgi:hypothetical protein